MSGPCLSSSVAGRPLRPATRLRLGRPLPHQLADRPRAHHEAPGLTVPGFRHQEIIPTSTFGISPDFSELFPTSWQITHVLRTLSPLERDDIATLAFPLDLHVLSTPPAFVLSQNQTLRQKNGLFVLSRTAYAALRFTILKLFSASAYAPTLKEIGRASCRERV